MTGRNQTIPKLVVRVRFPSPAQCRPGGRPPAPAVRGSAPHGFLPEEGPSSRALR